MASVDPHSRLGRRSAWLVPSEQLRPAYVLRSWQAKCFVPDDPGFWKHTSLHNSNRHQLHYVLGFQLLLHLGRKQRTFRPTPELSLALSRSTNKCGRVATYITNARILFPGTHNLEVGNIHVLKMNECVLIFSRAIWSVAPTLNTTTNPVFHTDLMMSSGWLSSLRKWIWSKSPSPWARIWSRSTSCTPWRSQCPSNSWPRAWPCLQNDFTSTYI